MRSVQPDPLDAQSVAHSAASTAPQATCGGAAATTTAGDTAADPATLTIPGEGPHIGVDTTAPGCRATKKLEAIGQKADRLYQDISVEVRRRVQV